MDMDLVVIRGGSSLGKRKDDTKLMVRVGTEKNMI